ncbi:MAG: hypothetical protein OXE44_14530 [Nitrospinae bacterium]|nr:hypothetical protein [Nitrospinota bacterium]
MTDEVEAENERPEAKGESECSPVETDEYSDNRKRWDWKSRYPSEAKKKIRFEAKALLISLVLSLLAAGLFLSLGRNVLTIPSSNAEAPPIILIDPKLVAIFLVGCVGGVTHSIKWLVHSVATGKWHLDRRYWRLLVPWTGGVYALVVLALIDTGLFPGTGSNSTDHSMVSPALAFLAGYFSDGVSGLLSNVANAVFGTLEKK